MKTNPFSGREANPPIPRFTHCRQIARPSLPLEIMLDILFSIHKICVTTIKPEVQITRKCLAQVRTRVAVADLAFSSSKLLKCFN